MSELDSNGCQSRPKLQPLVAEISWAKNKVGLTREFVRGFSKSNLKYRQRSPILQSAIAKLSGTKKLQLLSAKTSSDQKSQSRSGQFLIFQSATGKSAIPQTGIHAREYKLYLPSKEELRQKLEEWAREVEDE